MARFGKRGTKRLDGLLFELEAGRRHLVENSQREDFTEEQRASAAELISRVAAYQGRAQDFQRELEETGSVAASDFDRWFKEAKRFAYLTQLLEFGVDHFAVSIQLGHTDGGALVMERYGHPSVDAAKARLLRAFELGTDETGSATGSREAAN